MKVEVSRQLEEIEKKIREGEGQAARDLFGSLVQGFVPTEHLARAAQVARRLQMPAQALRLLSPVVRPLGRQRAQASDIERAEYGAALVAIGAIHEGLSLLESVDASVCPSSLLYRSFGLFARWDYAQAIPLLERYVRGPLDEYAKKVGLVNLVAAYVVVGDATQAEVLLRQLVSDLQNQGYNLLLGNVLELSAQLAIVRGDWAQADGFLDEAHRHLVSTSSLGEFFVRKWKAVVRLLKHPGESVAREGLRAIRREAEERSHWETIRESDLFEAIAMRDRELFLRVYFGSPYDSYRQRILKMYPDSLSLPLDYEWRLDGAIHGSPRTIRLVDGDFGEGLKLRPGQLPHRLLVALSADLYRPAGLGHLHARLYPDEHFNPFSSPNRIHQAVKRLRQWLEGNGVLLSIIEDAGTYRYGSESQVILQLGRSPLEAAEDPALSALRQAFGNGDFTAREASEFLLLSPRSTVRLLSQAVDQELILRFGKGSAVRYQFIRS